MTSLLLCDSCQRHVKDTESACPFCGARVEISRRVANGDPQSMRDRSLILFGAAAVAGAVALSACGTSTNNNGGGGGGTVVAPYGVPIPTQPDAGPTPQPPPNGDGTGVAVPAYGAPPPMLPPTTSSTSPAPSTKSSGSAPNGKK